jgi:hypothetical protein
VSTHRHISSYQSNKEHFLFLLCGWFSIACDIPHDGDALHSTLSHSKSVEIIKQWTTHVLVVIPFEHTRPRCYSLQNPACSQNPALSFGFVGAEFLAPSKIRTHKRAGMAVSPSKDDFRAKSNLRTSEYSERGARCAVGGFVR